MCVSVSDTRVSVSDTSLFVRQFIVSVEVDEQEDFGGSWILKEEEEAKPAMDSMIASPPPSPPPSRCPPTLLHVHLL